jgi:SWI/SNF-related matrix-associated actin-dependent regulator of chromatin subfamily A member 5
VVDEAHRIKNEHTNLAKSVRKQRASHRLLITGTPLQNNLHELWALLNFLMPQIFDDCSNFDSIYEDMTGDRLGIKDPKEIEGHVATLQKIIKPFMIRRLKAEVDKTIPPKKEIYVFVGMTNMQRNL